MAEQPVSISIDISGWESLIKNMLGRMKNVSDLLHTAYNTIGFADIQRHFRNAESPSGTWKALKYRIGQPLQDTGHLRDSLLPASAGYRKINNLSIMIFSNARGKDGSYYGRIHNEGGGNIPKREFMWLSSESKDRMAQYLTNMIVDGRA